MKPLFRIVTVPCSLVAALCLLLAALIACKERPAGPLRASLVRYEIADTVKAGEHDSCYVAVLWLTNVSSKAFWVVNGGLTGDFHACEFRSRTPTGFTNWLPRLPRTNGVITELLKAHSGMMVEVPVPNEERTTQVAIICSESSTNLAQPWRELRRIWRSVLPHKIKGVRAWCDRELSYAEAASKLSTRLPGKE
jgi:hypothetical protein